MIHYFDQRSDEWYDIRKGRLGASNANAIFAAGSGLDTAIIENLAAKYSTAEEKYTNADIERGIELEDTARSYYEIANDVTVEQVGYVEYSEYIGCSPDGLVGEDGGVEIKCVNNANFFKAAIGKPEKKYIDQCKMSIIVTGRKWWDLIHYNPNFENPIRTWHIEIDDEEKTLLTEKIQLAENKMREKDNLWKKL